MFYHPELKTIEQIGEQVQIECFQCSWNVRGEIFLDINYKWEKCPRCESNSISVVPSPFGEYFKTKY